MTRRRRWIAVIVAAAGLFPATPIVAATRPARGRSVAVRLGTVRGRPGAKVRVPIRLTVPAGASVGAVGATIRFDPRELDYLGARPGRSLARVAGEVLASERAESSRVAVLRIAAVTRDPAHFGAPLRSGVVVWLRFRVRAGVRGRKLVLEHRAEAACAGMPATRMEVQATSGRVLVERR